MRRLRLGVLGLVGVCAVVAGAYLMVTATVAPLRSALAAQGALLVNSLDGAMYVILFAVVVALARYALATHQHARLDAGELYFVGATLLAVVLLAVAMVFL